MYVLLVMATLSSGPSHASHFFPNGEMCEAVQKSLEKSFPEYQLKAVCVPYQFVYVPN